MGLFQQRGQEKENWAAIPGEPIDDDGTTPELPEPSAIDALDPGASDSVTSVEIPMDVPAEGADAEDNGASSDE